MARNSPKRRNPATNPVIIMIEPTPIAVSGSNPGAIFLSQFPTSPGSATLHLLDDEKLEEVPIYYCDISGKNGSPSA
jgi:hypothetical protein